MHILKMFCHESIYQTPLTFLVKNNRKKSSVESDIYIQYIVTIEIQDIIPHAGIKIHLNVCSIF